VFTQLIVECHQKKKVTIDDDDPTSQKPNFDFDFFFVLQKNFCELDIIIFRTKSKTNKIKNIKIKNQKHTHIEMQQPNLPAFRGQVFWRDASIGYQDAIQQYASTSDADVMRPAAVIMAANDDDVVRAIRYARENSLSVAIRTGGHHYIGMSSTSGRNIQLDLSQTYLEFDTSALASRNLVTCGISHSLAELTRKLKEHQVFVPHGVCGHVGVGGHLSTGGSGIFMRSFGLFIDHVVAFTIITADGVKRRVSKQHMRGLFFAVLGGAPGNMGVVTSVTLTVQRDVDPTTGELLHPYARGMNYAYFYRATHLRRLLALFADWNNNLDAVPADFNVIITVLSAGCSLSEELAYIRNDSRPWSVSLNAYKRLYAHAKNSLEWPSTIMITALWSNLNGRRGHMNDAQPWFDRLLETSPTNFLLPFFGGGGGGDPFRIPFGLFPKESAIGRLYISASEATPLSTLSERFIILPNPREFNTAYEKRTYLKSDNLVLGRDWVAAMFAQVEKIINPTRDTHGCHLSLQMELCGGRNSRLGGNQNNGTSYAHRQRKSTLFMDAFYPNTEQARAFAREWVAQNSTLLVGPHGLYARRDLRSLSFPYVKHENGEDADLSQIENWSRYYDSAEIYQFLVRIKRLYDPGNVFTPNSFALKGDRCPL